MELLTLNIEKLYLKSEYLHTNARRTHYHENSENPLFISWDDCVTVVYSLDALGDATLWNPIESMILPISCPVQSVLTFDSKVYCVDNVGTIYHLNQVQRDSPDLFDCSPTVQISQQLLSNNYKWTPVYTQKYPCHVFGATCYSDGIALIVTLDEWIIIQLLQITVNENNEIIVLNTCNKQIRSQKQLQFSVTSFVSCIWRDWFRAQRVIELFQPNVINSRDIFILATEESKIYCTTSNVNCKTATLFLNCPQNIVHVQFCNFESNKLLLVSSSGILTVIHCVENIPSSFIYLEVTHVITVFIIDHTVIISNGVYLFIITLDKQFSKIVKQVVTPLKGVVTLHRFQSNDLIAMTQLNQVYKLSPKYEVLTQEEKPKFQLNEKSILDNIKDLCKNIESLEEQHEQINNYINVVSIVARKDLVAQYCSLNVLIYSGAKAVKLGACPNNYIFAIRLTTDCSWLSFPSKFWRLLVRVTDNKNSSSTCELHLFDVDLFNNNCPLTVKHKLMDTTAENCTSGTVYCEMVCLMHNDLVNRCLVIPLNPVKLNALYFVKAEKQANIEVLNPLLDRHKYVFKFPDYFSLSECLTIITNRNKHRISKTLYKNIIDNVPKMLYLNFFGIIVSVVLDDQITKTITLECIDRVTLIAVRNGILNELSNDQPGTIKYSILADIQKQLCLLEELSVKDRHNESIVKEIKTNIQNQISSHLPV